MINAIHKHINIHIILKYSFIFWYLLSVCILIYVRYCEICQYYELYSISNRVIQLNKLGLWLGIFSCLGLSIVANFQETNVKYVHYFGATLCFGLGTAYFWIQVYFSFIYY